MMDALQDLVDNEGHRKRISFAVFEWAPHGESPATSTGPTGLNHQLLVKLLAELLQPSDGRMDICCMEACIFGADPATCQRVTADKASACCTATEAMPLSSVALP